jgi:hypothetical protein
VQSSRDCYLQRTADAELYRRLSEGEYCAVLAHRQTGKTSLAAATAWKLRSSGYQIAVVDLTQTSEEDPSENAGRWYYSIAYRIVRDLRIKFDIQGWWAERGGLTNLQRLREFFQEVVLGETSEPVVIFVDRIEATIGEPLAQDLFSAMRACYDARATDTEFQRLTFAMFGTGSANDFVKKVQGSPFEIASPILLPDFSAQELAGLLAGLGEPLDEAELLVGRVWSWTRGHPYLSQKVFRALARRKGTKLDADAVDELVHTQFVGPQTINEEPHLSAIAELLLRDTSNRTARLNLYGRIRKGVDVMLDSSSVVQRELLTTGLISVGANDQLRVRNEIYAMVFGTRWVNTNLPFGVKSLAVAAAIIAAVLAAPVWYNEYLPKPYVNALSVANQNFQIAEEAYESLSMLPGYGGTADRLFQDYLMRMGRQADTLPEITRASNQLRELPQGEELAEQMLADFWERRATEAVHSGDRDGALVALLEALQVPTERRRRWAAELVGPDYPNLRATWHTGARLRSMRVQEAAGLVTLLDAANDVQIWNIAEERPRPVRSLSIVAEERLEFTDRRLVADTGTNPRFYVQTNHPSLDQLEATLRAPSGSEAELRLQNGRQLGDGLYEFSFANDASLRSLLTDDMSGTWTLSLTDSASVLAVHLTAATLITFHSRYLNRAVPVMPMRGSVRMVDSRSPGLQIPIREAQY